MPKTSIKILLIEDNPADALLLEESLGNDLLTNFQLTVAERLELGLKKLKSEKFDILLLDLGLPDSQGLETFETAHTQFPEMPVIVLSGRADELFALQAVQAGAQDYLVKGEAGWSLASRAIRYALERHQSQAAMRASEIRFSTIFHASPTSIAITRISDNKIIEVNEAWTQITGYSAAEVVGQTINEFNLWAHPEDRKNVIGILLRDGVVHEFEFQMRQRSGQVADMLFSAELIEIDGEPCMLSIAQDITERKQTEDKLRKLSRTVEQSPASIVITDVQGNIEYVNPKFTEVTGYSLEEALGQNPRILKSENSSEQEYKNLWETIIAGDVWHGEFLNKKKDGKTYWEFATIAPVFSNEGQITNFLAIKENITERKESEQKLIQSTNQLRLINEATRKLNTSLKAEHVYQVIYASVSQLIPCDTLFISSFDTAKNMITLTGGWHDGQPLDVSPYNPVPLEPEGSGTQSQVIRTKQPLLVPDFQARLKNTQGIHHFNGDGKPEDSPPEEEDIPRSALVVPLVAEDEVFGVIQVFNYRINAYTEDDLQILNGFSAQAAIALSNARLYENIQQENLERKRAEEALQISENKYRVLFNEMLSGFALHEIICNEQGKPIDYRFLSTNPAFEEMTGMVSASTIGKTVLEIMPETELFWIERYGQVAITRQPAQFENYSSALGKHFEVRVFSPEPGQFATIFNDITERKQTEAALNESRLLFKLLIETLPQNIYAKDVNGRFIFANQHYCATEGKALEAILGKTDFELHPLELAEKYLIDDQQVIMAEKTIEKEEEHQPIGESKSVVQVIKTPFYYSEGKPAGILGIFWDITERKQADEYLRQRVNALELLYESGLIFSQLLNPKEIAQKIIELLGEKLNWHHTAIRLVRPQDQSLELVAFDQPGEESPSEKMIMQAHLNKLITRFDEGLTGWALQQSKIVRSGDVGSDPRYVPSFSGINSGLYVPLKSGEHPIGVISIESEKPDAFSEADEHLIATLASQAANAFENARLYEESTRYAEELEERVQQRTAEIELTKQRLELAVKTAGIGIWELDITQNKDYWDDPLFTLYGLTKDNILASPVTWHNVLHPDDLEQQLKLMDEAVNHKQPYNTEFRVIWPDKSIHYIKATGIVIYNAAGVPERMIGANRDITLDKQAEETLRLANAEMERGMRIKNEFMANMSHELRTPLNAILGISESLEEQIAGTLNEKQLKYVRIINESGHHLLDLINDVLDLSKIEAGKLEIDIQPVSVEKLCSSSLRLVKELAQKKSLHISFKIDENIKIILGDERRLKQSLVNLLGNAVKFTPQGKKIGLEVRGNPGKNEINFIVWDEGIGITQEDIKLLFQPFVQLNAGFTREFSGTGLGLALVAQMVNMHGGSINLTSELNVGSRFTMTLPWMPTEQGIQTPIKPQVLADNYQPKAKRTGKILLAEDTEVVAHLISEYLQHRGYEVILAQDGLESVVLAKQEHPQLILMDIMMPVMNGLDAARQIRADASLQNVPIIALTALAMSGDREKCIAAGMNDHISKPIQMQELAQIIERYLIPADESQTS